MKRFAPDKVFPLDTFELLHFTTVYALQNSEQRVSSVQDRVEGLQIDFVDAKCANLQIVLHILMNRLLPSQQAQVALDPLGVEQRRRKL